MRTCFETEAQGILEMACSEEIVLSVLGSRLFMLPRILESQIVRTLHNKWDFVKDLPGAKFYTFFIIIFDVVRI